MRSPAIRRRLPAQRNSRQSSKAVILSEAKDLRRRAAMLRPDFRTVVHGDVSYGDVSWVIGTAEAIPLKDLKLNSYFITPRWAIPILSRVEFFTRYIISSAWRITSCGVLASCG